MSAAITAATWPYLIEIIAVPAVEYSPWTTIHAGMHSQKLGSTRLKWLWSLGLQSRPLPALGMVTHAGLLRPQSFAQV